MYKKVPTIWRRMLKSKFYCIVFRVYKRRWFRNINDKDKYPIDLWKVLLNMGGPTLAGCCQHSVLKTTSDQRCRNIRLNRGGITLIFCHFLESYNLFEKPIRQSARLRRPFFLNPFGKVQEFGSKSCFGVHWFGCQNIIFSIVDSRFVSNFTKI